MERGVERKSDNLERYLAAISFNLAEKTEILRYVLDNNGGRYLEIGSGGDPFAEIVKHAPAHTETELIAIDADPAVLEHLLARHPTIPDIALQKDISIKLIPMDATDMRAFEDESFDAINASSLVHEIFSYAGGFKGVRKFIQEADRILKPGGTLVYRDPEFNYPLVRAKMEIKDPQLKALSLLYLFNATVDQQHVSESNSPSFTRFNHLYDSDSLTITATLLGEHEPTTITLAMLVHIPIGRIDFTQPVFIESENGVLQEITRHFLTSYQCSPYGNILLEPNEDGGASVNYVSSGTKERFSAFVQKYNIEVSNQGELSPANHARLQARIAETFDFLTKDTHVILNEAAAEQLFHYAQQLGFDPNISMRNNDDGTYRIDSMLMSVVFEYAIQTNLLDKNSFINETAFDFFTYLKQEGQEFYYYLTPDEIVAVFAAVSSERGDGYMLVPNIDIPQTNRTVERPKYTQYLNAVITVRSLDPDISDDMILPRENKRIIHFVKVPTSQGVAILQRLIDSSE